MTSDVRNVITMGCGPACLPYANRAVPTGQAAL